MVPPRCLESPDVRLSLTGAGSASAAPEGFRVSAHLAATAACSGSRPRVAQGIAVVVERDALLADVLHAQAADVREAGWRELIEVAARREVAMMCQPTSTLHLSDQTLERGCLQTPRRRVGGVTEPRSARAL